VDPVFDCVSVAEDLAAANDPRLDQRYLRCVPATDGRQPVLLVGVVHDHPASVTRVTRVLELVDPETLAVELPPLAMPLFEQYADDPHRPPRLGGEMSAAIQGTDSPAVGIDAPTRTYFSRLVERVRDERPSRGVPSRLVRDLGSAVAHALACRVASVLADYTPLRLRVYDPIVHSCSLVDTADVQAADERAFLDRRDALFRAVRPPTSTRLIDGAREAAMSDLLDRARREGSVIAVVGMEHLDDVEADLRRAGADEVSAASDDGSK
jgi:pheromone shutdown protein TraB